MIEHIWSVLCESVLVDRQGNKASYIGTLSSIPISSVDKKTDEILLSPFVIVTKIHKTNREEEHLSLRFLLKSKGGQTVQKIATADENLEGRAIFAELNIEITQMTIEQEGDYQLFVDIKPGSGGRWKNVASMPFIVKSKPLKRQLVMPKEV